MQRPRVVLGLLMVLMACGQQDVPKHLESSFSMQADALAFANFAGEYQGSAMDAALLQRMFGNDVCLDTTQSPCTLRPSARAFVDRANEAMENGRCEGFAVLSELFAAGKLQPSDFGADAGRDLALDGNTALQRELAYWFSTQLVPSAADANAKRYMAKDVMPALVDALKSGATERWRIGIVRKKGSVISGGHALTPIGYYADATEAGVYWLRVYDNNRPDAERLMKLDVTHNRWEFEASETPATSSRLYFGDETNQNPLYFAPVLSRTGVLPCFFCKDDGAAQVVSSGGAQVSLETASGTVGVVDGGLDDATFPSLSAPTDDHPASFRTSVPAGTTLDVHVSYGPDADHPNVTQGVQVASRGFTVTASDLLVTGDDRLRVQNGGSSVQYANTSRTSLTLKSEVELTGGRALSLSAVVAGGSDEVRTAIDPDAGTVAIAAGGSQGAQVTLVVTATDPTGNQTKGQLTFTSQGDAGVSADTSSWVDGGQLTGTIVNNGTMTVVTNACEDGVKSGMETDVDCGSVCNTKCSVGQGCGSGADCVSGFCDATGKTCVATSCEDHRRSGDETDVDCGGGSCGACAVGQACAGGADCAGTAACVSHQCVATWAVGLSVSGLPVGASVVLQDNGGDDLSLSAAGSFAFPTRVTGTYAVTIKTQPDSATCAVSNGAGTATADVSNVTITCTPSFAVGGTLSGLPASATMVLQDNGGDDLSLSANGSFTFATRVGGAYAVTVKTAPGTAVCTVTAGTGTANADVSSVSIVCVPTFAIGGTLSGLPSLKSVQLGNGPDTITLTGDGSFSFPTRTPGPYGVVIAVQPAGVTCAVANGVGTAVADVTNVTVTCTVSLPSGTLDTAFAGTGWFAFSTSPGSDYARTMQLEGDGSMVIAGQAAVNGSDNDMVVAKVRADGTLDPSFGTAGVLTISLGVAYESVARIFPDGMGGYLLAGTLAGATDADFGVARITPTGMLNPLFGTAGTSTFDSGRWDYCEGAAQDANGNLVLVGRHEVAGGGSQDLVVVRVKPDGTLDTTFATNGWFIYDAGGSEVGQAVTIDATSGELTVFGHKGTDTVVLRLDGNGVLVPGFGTSGVATFDLSGVGADELVYTALADGTGVVFGGWAGNGGNADLVVGRLTATGALDPNFGVNGVLKVDLGGTEVVHALTPAPIGWYVGGEHDSSLLLSHVLPNGTIDGAFATSGTFAQTFGGFSAAAYAVATDGVHLLAAGTIRTTGSEDLGVVRIFP